MRRIASFVITLGVAAGLAIGCGGDDGVTGTNGGNGGGNGGGGADVTVEVIDNAYVDPDGNQNSSGSVTINLGESILFNATGSNPHTVTTGEGEGGNAGSGVPQGGTAINRQLSAGGSVTWEPDATGTWTIYCEVHPGTMFNFTITVQ